MCGRARLSTGLSEIKLVSNLPPDQPVPNFAPTYNLAPTDPIPIVRYDPGAGCRNLVVARWGLIRQWKKLGPKEKQPYATAGVPPPPLSAGARGFFPFIASIHFFRVSGLAHRVLAAALRLLRTAGSEQICFILALIFARRSASIVLPPTRPAYLTLALSVAQALCVIHPFQRPGTIRPSLRAHPTHARCPDETLARWPVSQRVGNVKNNDPSLVEPGAVT